MMVELWLERKIPTTLNNISDPQYERLKATAEAHQRSLGSQAIVCLESALLPGRLEPHWHCAPACRKDSD